MTRRRFSRGRRSRVAKGARGRCGPQFIVACHPERQEGPADARRGSEAAATPTAERRTRRAADAADAEERRKRPLATLAERQAFQKRGTTSGRIGVPEVVPLVSWPRRDGACPPGVLQCSASFCVAREARLRVLRSAVRPRESTVVA